MASQTTVTVLIKAQLPEGVKPRDFRAYVLDAVMAHCGSLDPLDDMAEARNWITVLTARTEG